jgi:hypothetical protein
LIHAVKIFSKEALSVRKAGAANMQRLSHCLAFPISIWIYLFTLHCTLS